MFTASTNRSAAITSSTYHYFSYYIVKLELNSCLKILMNLMIEFFKWYFAEGRWFHRISPPFLVSEKRENFVSIFLFHTDFHQGGNI